MTQVCFIKILNMLQSKELFGWENCSSDGKIALRMGNIALRMGNIALRMEYSALLW